MFSSKAGKKLFSLVMVKQNKLKFFPHNYFMVGIMFVRKAGKTLIARQNKLERLFMTIIFGLMFM